MCKAVDRDMVISRVRLDRKTGGRSGTYVREAPPPEEVGEGRARRTGGASARKRGT
jgi:cyclic pyranopterin phosphate synthase